MVAYLRPLVSCRLYTTIIRQRKKDFGEIKKKKSKNTVKRMLTLELCLCKPWTRWFAFQIALTLLGKI